ncbi:MAG: MFS transporter [Gemmatimonadota bacterium]|nr:MAG: MFS transporter [Gemmatimonadota bacterium]
MSGRWSLLRRIFNQPRNVLGLGAVSFFNDVSSEMIYPLLPTFLVRVLGASLPAVGLIEGAAESINSFVKLFAGSLSDRLGRRKPLVALGYGLAALARPLIAGTEAVWQVLTLRLTDRLGKGIRSAPRDALLAKSAPPGALGLAFGTQRALDHAGALLGPILAGALLLFITRDLRLIFALSAIPAALTLLLLWRAVSEVPRAGVETAAHQGLAGLRSPELRRTLFVFFVFTLANSTDAFLLLRASQLGVATAMLPFLWAAFHASKTFWSFPGGDWADRFGARGVIAAGWAVYALVYLGFALAFAQWHAWALFIAYGLYFGLAEGPEKALVAQFAQGSQLGAAMGGYQLAVGVGALPASLAFGLLWQWAGPSGAFLTGAGVAGLALVFLLTLVPGNR